MSSTNKDTIILERRFVAEDTLVIKQGEDGNCAYLIQSGSVEVYTEHDGKKINLAKLELGQIFGEMALVFDGPRTASVKTLEDCNFIVITRQALNDKLKRSDATIRALVEMLINRMISANNAIIQKKTGTQDLIDTTRIIYQNIFAALPQDQKSEFQKEVLPKLDEFMGAIQDFQSRSS